MESKYSKLCNEENLLMNFLAGMMTKFNVGDCFCAL